jgi:hypothetical protein
MAIHRKQIKIAVTVIRDEIFPFLKKNKDNRAKKQNIIAIENL